MPRRKKNGLPLTEETIRAAFEYLITTPPFNSWNLDGDDLMFSVAKDPFNYGWHLAWGRGKKRKRAIVVSARRVGHTMTLLMTVAHEICHHHLDLTGQATGAEHNAAFKKIAEQVCAVHGFDPRSF